MSFRVIQKNLLFVVGLSQRLADVEVCVLLISYFLNSIKEGIPSSEAVFYGAIYIVILLVKASSRNLLPIVNLLSKSVISYENFLQLINDLILPLI